MNPLLLKALPWVVSVAAIVGGVWAYGEQREADGRAEAAIEMVAELQKKYTADSTANARREAIRQDSLTMLTLEIEEERENRRKAEVRASTAVADLRQTLTGAQAVKLDAIVAEHQLERDAWQAEEKKWAAQLALRNARVTDLEREVADLSRINDKATDVIDEGRPGFLSRVAPYALGAAGFAGLVTLVVSVAK